MLKDVFKRFTLFFLVVVMFFIMTTVLGSQASTNDNFNNEPSVAAPNVVRPTNASVNATYTVGDSTYNYLDLAIRAAGSNGTIVVASNGAVAGSNGQTSFVIPSALNSER